MMCMDALISSESDLIRRLRLTVSAAGASADISKFRTAGDNSQGGFYIKLTIIKDTLVRSIKKMAAAFARPDASNAPLREWLKYKPSSEMIRQKEL